MQNNDIKDERKFSEATSLLDVCGLSPRHSSTSPNEFKAEPMDDESAIESALTASASPTSSGEGSSVSDEQASPRIVGIPILTAESAKFELPGVQAMPRFDVAAASDIASGLLFKSVHWIKNVKVLGFKPNFFENTIKTKWFDVFVLSLVQCSTEFNFNDLLGTVSLNLLSKCAQNGKEILKYASVVVFFLY